MLTNICYLDIVNNKPILLSKKDIPLEDIKFVTSKGVILNDVDIVDLYKKKYNPGKIKEQQIIILSELDKIINQVKDILVILTDSKVSIDTEYDQVNNIIDTELFNVDFDIDTFFHNIGINLSIYYNNESYNKNSVSLDGLNRIDSAKKTLYYSMLESNWISSDDKYVDLGFVHVSFFFNQFLNVFNFLLKIKNKLSFFFSSLLENKEAMDKGINLFFLQFEYLVLFDIFYSTLLCSIYKVKMGNDLGLFRANYARYCRDASFDMFNLYFSDIGLFNVDMFMVLKTSILLSVEDSLYLHLNEKNTVSSFGQLLSAKLNDSLFVFNEGGTFAYLYDDCLIDFNYLLCMVKSLRFTFFTPPFFFSSFIDKHD